jgi:hypothetical protein
MENTQKGTIQTLVTPGVTGLRHPPVEEGVPLGKEAIRAKKKFCPECHSNALRRSQMRGVVERSILKPFGWRAYRCEDCDHRFFRHGGGGEPRRRDDSGSIKLK